MNFPGCITTTGHGTNHQRGTAGSITANKYIPRKFGLLRFQETHCQEAGLALDDFRFASLNHEWPASLRIRFPVYRLDTNTGEASVLAKELQRVDVPAAYTALFVT